MARTTNSMLASAGAEGPFLTVHFRVVVHWSCMSIGKSPGEYIVRVYEPIAG